jgi:hypothetical protein
MSVEMGKHVAGSRERTRAGIESLSRGTASATERAYELRGGFLSQQVMEASHLLPQETS